MELHQILDRYLGIPIVFFLKLFPFKKNSTLPSNPKKILIIKLVMVGDTILLSSAIKHLRVSFPDAHITMLCSPINEKIAKSWDFINEFESIKIKSLLSIFSFWKKYALKKQNRFDLILDFEQWCRFTAILSYVLFSPL